MSRADRTRSTVSGRPLDKKALTALDAWWRAANYLSGGQIYLMGNPLLRRPLEPDDVKPRLLGHWGTTPGNQRWQLRRYGFHGLSHAYAVPGRPSWCAGRSRS